MRVYPVFKHSVCGGYLVTQVVWATKPFNFSSPVLLSVIVFDNSLVHISFFNWPKSPIPECTCSISHNAPFRTEMDTFLFWMEHCGKLWNWSIESPCYITFCDIIRYFVTINIEFLREMNDTSCLQHNLCPLFGNNCPWADRKGLQ